MVTVRLTIGSSTGGEGDRKGAREGGKIWVEEMQGKIGDRQAVERRSGPRKVGKRQARQCRGRRVLR
jgi:hypothetical protein